MRERCICIALVGVVSKRARDTLWVLDWVWIGFEYSFKGVCGDLGDLGSASAPMVEPGENQSSYSLERS